MDPRTAYFLGVGSDPGLIVVALNTFAKLGETLSINGISAP
jgi:hypothetical protein